MSCFRASFHVGVRLSGRSRECLRVFSTVQDAPAFSTPLPVHTVQAQKSPLQGAVNATSPRMDWSRQEISDIYNTPLIELQYAAVSPLSALPW
jgi:biotin synthase